MAKASVSVKIDRQAVIRLVGPMTDQATYKVAQATRGRALKNIRAAGRVDTGRMQAGLQVRSAGKSGLRAAYTVSSSAPYTIFQEFGTRAHGPVRAPFMVFTPKGSGKVVFARWVRGVSPAYFMTRAFNDANIADAT